MAQATIRLYAELNDYLPPDRRMASFQLEFSPPADVRTILADLKIPESETDLVLVNGESVDLDRRVSGGDRISVYPVFESFDVSPIEKIHTKPLRQARFVLDVHLGKLASYLRLLGFDTLYRADFHDHQLIAISHDEKRIILSRDRRLIVSQEIDRGYCVIETNPRLQLQEVLRRFDLFNSVSPFQRCLRCNTVLKRVEKTNVVARLEQRTRENFSEFEICPNCERVYWKGSHYMRMQEFIGRVLQEGRQRPDYGTRPAP